MKFKILCLLALNVIFCYSQENSRYIELDWNKGENVVFNADYKPPFTISNFKSSFTPTNEQIEQAEKLLLEQYNSSKMDFVDNTNANSVEELKYSKKVKDVKKKLCKYKRQYIGYTTKENDTIIAIGLLNFKNKKKANKHFYDWENTYVIGFDGFYEENTEYFTANLTSARLSLGNGG